MRSNTARPYAAAYVILHQDTKIAFILRGATGWMDGYYSLPAGRVEDNESFSAAAVREAKEETGVDIKLSDLKPTLTMHRKSDDSEWVDLYFTPERWTGEPFNAEQAKHTELAWLDANNLPSNIIPEVRSALQNIQNGEHYVEYGWDKQR